MERIAIIDGNSLINRAYYAMRNPMITRDGIYTHGIFGFLNMLEKLRRDYGPKYMVVAFDRKGPTFRHEQYDEYKAGRKKMPPELAMQIPLLKEILDAMGITRIELDGFEADDIIGTVARSAEKQGLEPVIFTGDRDQLQLATDTTRVVFTKRGVSDFDIYDHDAFVEAYGFTPLQFIDFKGLAGDKSDNIPGVPGVGDKTATKLIQQFGSVEKIVDHVEDIWPAGLQKKIRENDTQALMSKRLATINTAVPLPGGEGAAQWKIRETDMPALVAIYQKLEFNRFLKKLDLTEVKAAGAKATPTGGILPDDAVSDAPASAVPAGMPDLSAIERVIIRDEGRLADIHLSGEAVLRIFGDNSHVADPVIDGAALLAGEILYYFDLEDMLGFWPWLAKQDLRLTGHDIKKDVFMMMSQGLDCFSIAFDTQVAAYVLDSGRSDYSLSLLAVEELGEGIPPEKEFLESVGQISLLEDNAEKYADYGLAWCAAVRALRGVQEEKVRLEGMKKVLYDIELPLIEVMASMEHEGFRADRQFLADFGEELSGQIDRLSEEICAMAGEEFNINSPVQLGTILFEKLNLPHGKKTKRGYSTSAEVLEKLVNKHEIVPAILEYRTLTKLKSTYVDGLIPLINSRDGKIHAHFMQTVAATGRISCVEPNLQNIPIRQELGRQLRKAFVPDDGRTLVGADYSQIELRVLAHMADDPALIDAFNRGEDIHLATAANVLGVPVDEITTEERSRAKAVNFGVIYGMSAFGLSSNLHITRKDAGEYINAYFAKHENVRAFMDDAVAFAKDRGYVETMFGRKRYIKEIHATQYMVRQIGERLAMNSPIQGSAADIIKIAMIRVYRALKEQGLQSKLILQIHDELIIHTLEEEKDAVKQLLVDMMEGTVEMKVKLKADLNEGGNWYELK